MLAYYTSTLIVHTCTYYGLQGPKSVSVSVFICVSMIDVAQIWSRSNRWPGKHARMAVATFATRGVNQDILQAQALVHVIFTSTLHYKRVTTRAASQGLPHRRGTAMGVLANAPGHVILRAAMQVALQNSIMAKGTVIIAQV